MSYADLERTIEAAWENRDAINIDITVIKEGFHGDTSRMFFVGKPGIQAERLATHWGEHYGPCHEQPRWRKWLQRLRPGG